MLANIPVLSRLSILASAIQKYDKGNYRGALADLNRAIQINPNYTDVYRNRGLLKYGELNDRSGAINDLKRAAELFQQQNRTQEYQEAIDTIEQWQQTGEN